MSYSRWSTLLPETAVTPELYRDWISGGPEFDVSAGVDRWREARSEWTARFLREHGLECSAWYIFHDVASGDTRDEQMLSVWHASVIGRSDSMPMMTYPQLRTISDAGRWSDIPGYDESSDLDQDHLRRCFRRFLQDVEAGYGGGSTASNGTQ